MIRLQVEAKLFLIMYSKKKFSRNSNAITQTKVKGMF